MNYYKLHLSKDKHLKKAIVGHKEFKLRKRKNLSLYLCASIMGQQLSGKVADVIYSRFLNLYGGAEPTPEQILNTPHEALRSIGLSNNKANYIRNVAAFSLEHGMDFKKLNRMNDEEVIKYLTQIKGVGRWTVEMLLMFALGREDVFAIDDYGVQSAMIGIYKLENLEKRELREKLIRISKKWSPYRTYACLHLWKWKDGM